MINELNNLDPTVLAATISSLTLVVVAILGGYWLNKMQSTWTTKRNQQALRHRLMYNLYTSILDYRYEFIGNLTSGIMKNERIQDIEKELSLKSTPNWKRRILEETYLLLFSSTLEHINIAHVVRKKLEIFRGQYKLFHNEHKDFDNLIELIDKLVQDVNVKGKIQKNFSKDYDVRFDRITERLEADLAVELSQ